MSLGTPTVVSPSDSTTIVAVGATEAAAAAAVVGGVPLFSADWMACNDVRMAEPIAVPSPRRS